MADFIMLDGELFNLNNINKVCYSTDFSGRTLIYCNASNEPYILYMPYDDVVQAIINSQKDED